MAKDAAADSVKWVLLAEIIIFSIVFLILNPLLGFFCVLSAVVCFFYYKNMAYQIFGGVTGDLAGYFLQVCELVILAVLAIGDICG